MGLNSPRLVTFLSLGAISLAGCLAMFSTDLDVYVRNETDASLDVNLRIETLSGKEKFEWRGDVGPGSTEDPMTAKRLSGTYRFHATSGNLSFEYEQSVGGGDYRWTVELYSAAICFNYFLDDYGRAYCSNGYGVSSTGAPYPTQ